MAANVEAKRQAHQMLDQLGPGQLEAVVRLLEIMLHPDDDTLTDEDRQAVAASREYFRQNPEGGVPFEQVVVECGFTIDEVRNYNGNP